MDELVVRLVIVEGTNHVIAIAPGIPSLVVVRETGRIRVARHIKPMLRHALAVVRGDEQTLDNIGKGFCIRPRVLHERFHLFRLRRQADEVKRRASNQRYAVGCGCYGESVWHLRRNEGIDRIALACGRRRLLDRLIRPQPFGFVFPVRPLGRETAGCLHHDSIFKRPLLFIRLRNLLHASFIRPRRATGDPVLDPRDLLCI